MNNITRCKPLLGTFVEISVEADADAAFLIESSEKAFNEMKKIENSMSFHNPESELSKLNRLAAKEPVRISDHLWNVLQRAQYYSELSDGAFDVTTAGALVRNRQLPDHGIKFSATANWENIKMESNNVFYEKPLLIDLGGIAKGYAVDLSLKTIKRCSDMRYETNRICVNAGGDLKMEPWEGGEIGIRIPKKPYTDVVQVAMKNSAIATSSPYFGSAIIGKNNRVVGGDISVSVFSENCIDADALTKIFWINSNYSHRAKKGHKCLTLNEQGIINWGGQK